MSVLSLLLLLSLLLPYYYPLSIPAAASYSVVWYSHWHGRRNAVFFLNLWICVDADVSSQSHVLKTVSSCLAVLRHLRSIRHAVDHSSSRSYTNSLGLWNVTLAGLADQSLDDCGQSSRLPLVWSSCRASSIIRRRFHANYNGCVFPRG